MRCFNVGKLGKVINGGGGSHGSELLQKVMLLIGIVHALITISSLVSMALADLAEYYGQ